MRKVAVKPRGFADIGKMIVPVDDVAGDYARVLVYGRTGKNKTRFACSGPKCLLLDADNKGSRSARNLGAKRIPIKEWETVPKVYWWLRSTKHPFETVALDTLTQIHKLALRFCLGEAELRDPSRPPSNPDRRVYNHAQQLMDEWLPAFANLPMHVVFTAQEKKAYTGEDDDDLTEFSEVTFQPALPPGCLPIACGVCDVVGRLYKKEVTKRTRSGKRVKEWEPQLYVGDHVQLETKDRTNALGKVVRNPTMTKVINAYRDTEV